MEISVERLFAIAKGSHWPRPDEVMLMAQKLLNNELGFVCGLSTPPHSGGAPSHAAVAVLQ